MATPNNGIPLKILVDTKNQKVVFAEVDKYFVDFLYNISFLPLSTVMKLLNNQGFDACLTKIYNTCGLILPSLNRDDILKPKCVTFTDSNDRALPYIHTSTSSTLHVCNKSAHTATNFPLRRCTSYSCIDYSEKRTLVVPQSTDYVPNKGYVQEGTYMVMDDLSVRPASGIDTVHIFNGFDIKNVGTLEAREVRLGADEALKLLKASIQSKTVLTDVFLGENSKEDSK